MLTFRRFVARSSIAILFVFGLLSRETLAAPPESAVCAQASDIPGSVSCATAGNTTCVRSGSSTLCTFHNYYPASTATCVSQGGNVSCSAPTGTAACTYTGTGAMRCVPYVNTATTPGQATWSNTVVGTSQIQSVAVSNSGTEPFAISSKSITGANAAEFAVVADGCPLPIPPGTVCYLSVQFTPAAAGQRYANFALNGSPGGTALSGFGTTIPAALSLVSSPPKFGTNQYGVTSAEQTFTVKNTGGSPLNVTGIVPSRQDYQVTSNTCPMTPASLAAGASCVIGVTFTPRAAGVLDAEIRITHTGTGGAMGVGVGGAGVGLSGLTFGGTTIGGTNASRNKSGEVVHCADDEKGESDLDCSDREDETDEEREEREAREAREAAEDACRRDPKCVPLETIVVNASRWREDHALLALVQGLQPFLGQGAGFGNNVVIPINSCINTGAANIKSPSLNSSSATLLASASQYPILDIGSNVSWTDSAFVGDPIHGGHGNKAHVQTDYWSEQPYRLRFSRVFHSLASDASGLVKQPVGVGWYSNWDRSIALENSGDTARLFRGNGGTLVFLRKADGSWMSTRPRSKSSLVRNVDGNGSTIGWTYQRSKTTENYNAQGRLASVAVGNAGTYVLSYEQITSGRLLSVADPNGRKLVFTYGTNGQLATLKDPAGGVFSYAYDALGRLTSVTYPDNRTRQYRYEHAKFKFALTSIINESGQLHVTFSYDDVTGRATGNWFGNDANNPIGKVQLQFTASGSVATDPGALPSVSKVTREYVAVQGEVLPKKLRIEDYDSCGSSCTPLEISYVYDNDGRVLSKTDLRGVTTTYTYTTDGRGLLASTTAAAGTSIMRTVTTVWHPTLRLPTQVIEPTRTTNYTYDSAGRKLTESVTAGAETRTTSYTRNAQGQITSVNGPRTDVNDITTYTYHADGNVYTVTTPLGQTTTYNSYDVHGNVTSVTAHDGTVSSFAYDARGRLVAKNIGGLVSYYGYNMNGQLVVEVDPYDQYTVYYYDAAQRLIGKDLTNGDKIRYTLDSAGRTIVTQTFDAQNILSTHSSTVYDRLGRMKQRIDANNKVTSYTYDANGNVTSTTDPNGLTTATAYDALNRPILVTDPLQKTVAYTYNADSKVASVKDPNNNYTTYTYNGFGDNTAISSADTGNTTVSFNAAGLPVLKTDSRGKTTTYVYDAGGRIVWYLLNDGANTYHSYQVSGNGVGQLAAITDPSGTTQFYYDAYGRVTQKNINIGGITRFVQYARDVKGRVTNITYPSGSVVGMTYTNNRVTSLSLNGVTVVDGIQYFPFGGPESWLFKQNGTSKEYTRWIDLNNRIYQYLTPGGYKQIWFDNGGRIGTIRNVNGLASPVITKDDYFGYDGAGRITAYAEYGYANGVIASGPTNVQYFAYDSNGNRTGNYLNGVYTGHSYAANSNRLINTVLGNVTQTSTYDAAGNLTNDGAGRTFVYDARGRMTSASKSGLTTSYLINYQNLRVRKANAQETRGYIYDDSGHMIAEFDQTGTSVQETIWLGDIPVVTYGVVPCANSTTGVGGVPTCTETNIGFIWTDHLDTPREVTRLNNAGQHVSLWRWEGLPFGETVANQNASNLGQFTFNHRFPGQYYDRETGLHYNWHRDYDAKLGRYIESDPIGLTGGVNTFSYVDQSPLMRSDREGLMPVAIVVLIVRAVTLIRSVLQACRILRQDSPPLPPNALNALNKELPLGAAVKTEAQIAKELSEKLAEIESLALSALERNQMRVNAIAQALSDQGYTAEQVVRMLGRLLGGGTGFGG